MTIGDRVMKIPTLATLLLASSATLAAEPPLPAPVRSACNAEIERLCGDVHGPTQVLECLRGNDRLSDHNCKDALRTIGAMRTEMPPGGHYDASRGRDKTAPPAQ
jgi:hypothetical protein